MWCRHERASASESAAQCRANFSHREAGRRMSPLTSWGAISLVAGREIRTRVASKAFRISSIAMVLTVIAFVIVAKLISGSDSASKVGFTPSASPLSAPFASLAGAVGEKVTTSEVDQSLGETRVRD